MSEDSATGSGSENGEAVESGDAAEDTETADGTGDTFGVAIAVTPEEFRFVVHVPSDIDAGWSDPETFQRRIETVTWDLLDKEETLGRLSRTAFAGETVTLGTVTMRPDGTVVSHALSAPEVETDERR